MVDPFLTSEGKQIKNCHNGNGSTLATPSSLPEEGGVLWNEAAVQEAPPFSLPSLCCHVIYIIILSCYHIILARVTPYLSDKNTFLCRFFRSAQCS